MNLRSLVHGFAVLLGLLCAGLAHAQDRGSAGQSKVYVGGALGRVGYDTDFERTKAVIRGTGATSFTVTANGTDTAWKSYLGYLASRHISVEAGYWNFGQLDLSASVTAPASSVLRRTYRADGYGADAVVWLPVYDSWSGLVKASAMLTNVRASATEPGGGLTALPAESARKLNAHWGVGLEYRLTPAAAVRVEYETVRKVGDESKFGNADLILWTLGANYRF